MITLHENQKGITAMRGRKCIAVARNKRPHGWMLTGYFVSWIGAPDKRWPHLWRVKTKADAIWILKTLK